MRRNRKANAVISLILAVVLAWGVVPSEAQAASSKEIQKQIDGLKSKKAELQKEIDLALRSRWLYDKYRMDPALMQDLNDKYGTLEWRLPEAQAIYWATMGLIKTPSHKDISCERIITQSLYEGFRAGRILRLAPDDLSTILLAPNLELVDAVRKTYDEAYERNQANSSFPPRSTS